MAILPHFWSKHCLNNHWLPSFIVEILLQQKVNILSECTFLAFQQTMAVSRGQDKQKYSRCIAKCPSQPCSGAIVRIHWSRKRERKWRTSGKSFPSCSYLCFKTSPGVQPFSWKRVSLERQWTCKKKINSIWEAVHQNAFSNRGKSTSEMAY